MLIFSALMDIESEPLWKYTFALYRARFPPKEKSTCVSFSKIARCLSDMRDRIISFVSVGKSMSGTAAEYLYCPFTFKAGGEPAVICTSEALSSSASSNSFLRIDSSFT